MVGRGVLRVDQLLAVHLEPLFRTGGGRTDGGPAVEESGSRVALLALDSDADTPGESRHVLFEQTAVDTQSFDVERTITDVGTRLRLRLAAEGTAAVGLDSLVVEVDTDGDGLWNHEERGGVVHPVYGDVELDPTSADTDGDGLRDDAEVGEPQPGQFGVYYKLDSRPDRVDTDGDGLRDATEVRAFESEPKDEDTDGDGLTDFQDPRPSVDDRLPQFELAEVRVSYTRILVENTHAPIESVTSNAYFEQRDGCGPAGWKPENVVVDKLDEGEYIVDTLRRCFFDRPEKYYVNVTDANGNRVVFLINLTDSGGKIVEVMAATGGVFLSPQDLEILVTGAVGIALLSTAFVLGKSVYQVTRTDGATTTAPAYAQITEPVARYHVDGHDLRLPRGTAETTTVDPATGEAITHGFGWAYIAATITEEKEVPADEEITRSELRRMIENGKVVVEEGVEYIVTRGGPLPPEARLLLRVVGGQIVGYTVREVIGGGRDDDREGDEELEVHHIDVGKGSSTLVEAPNGETMLVDAGGKNETLADRVRTYLKSEGIDTIDYLVLTHTHRDHIRGVIPLLEDPSIDVGAVYISGIRTGTNPEAELLEAIRADPTTELHTIRRGDGGHISPGSVDVDVLNPPDSPRDEWNKDTQRKKWDDSNALVLKLSYEGETFLLPSDIRDRVEDELGEHREVTTMTASHHGSKDANSGDFYNNTRPSRVVVTAGSGGPQTPPDREVFDRLAGLGVAAYWTAVHGNVTFVVDDGAVFVEVEDPATTDPDELKDRVGESTSPLLRAPVPP